MMSSQIDLFASDKDFLSYFVSNDQFVCAGCLRKRTTTGSLEALADGWCYALCGPCDKALRSPNITAVDRQAKAEQIARNLVETPVKKHRPRRDEAPPPG